MGAEYLSKQDLINRTAERTGFAKSDVEIVLDEAFDVIRDALVEGADVRIRQFGTFSVKSYDERTGRNPNTGEAIAIPAKKKVRFKVAKTLNDAVN